MNDVHAKLVPSFRSRLPGPRAWSGLARPLLVVVVLGAPGRAASEPLSPARAVSLAWQHNPDLAAALLEVQQARQGVAAEEARYSWTLTADAGLSQVSTPSLRGDDVTVGRGRSLNLGGGLRRSFASGTALQFDLSGAVDGQDSSSVMESASGDAGSVTGYGLVGRVTLTQPLLRGQGTAVNEAALRQARIVQEMAGLRAERTASELLRDLLGAYWALWGYDAVLSIQTQARDLAARQLAEIEAKVAKGSVAPVETLSFATILAAREEELVAARDSRLRQAQELVRLVGLPELDPAALELAADLPEEGGVAPELPVVVAAARDASFSLQVLAAQWRLASEQAGIAGESQRPRLDLQAWLQGQGLGADSPGPALTSFGTAEAVGAFVGLSLELPLDTRQRRAQQEEALLGVRVAEQDLLAETRRLESLAAGWVSRRTAADRRLVLARQTEELARAQVTAARRRYEIGTAIALEVQQAEDTLRTAQLRVAQARIDRVAADLGLADLTNTLLPRWSAQLNGAPAAGSPRGSRGAGRRPGRRAAPAGSRRGHRPGRRNRDESPGSRPGAALAGGAAG